jgi:hypothetical protein
MSTADEKWSTARIAKLKRLQTNWERWRLARWRRSRQLSV